MPLRAGPVSLRCVLWSSPELQTRTLGRELVFISASISINGNAGLKVLDSDGRSPVGFYFISATAVTRPGEMETPLPSCTVGEKGFKAALRQGFCVLCTPPGSRNSCWSLAQEPEAPHLLPPPSTGALGGHASPRCRPPPRPPVQGREAERGKLLPDGHCEVPAAQRGWYSSGNAGFGL